MTGSERLNAALREHARRLLETGEVGVVIGFGAGTWGAATRPVIVTSPTQAEALLFNDRCVNNPCVYLSKPHIKKLGRAAVVAKGCDVRSLMVLIQENQVLREDVVILGVCCAGVVDMRPPGGQPQPMAKCSGCQVQTPPQYDHLFGEELPPSDHEPDRSAVSRIEAMALDERWQFWMAELERCLKCYACRAACPLCYCARCFVDKTRPAWTSSSQSARDNLVFHLFRALHLAGRCAGCGECARVCPQQIPLDLLNQRMAGTILDRYGHVPGLDAEAASPLLVFDPADTEDFIR